MGSVRGSGTSGYIQTNKFILPNTYYRYVKDIRIRNRSVTNKKNANERKEDDDENSSKGTKQRIEDIVRQLNDKDKTKRIRKNEIKKVLNLGVEYCNKTLTGATFSSVTIAINKSLTRLKAVMFGEKDSRVSGNRVLQSVRVRNKHLMIQNIGFNESVKNSVVNFKLFYILNISTTRRTTQK